ncbi:putative cytochrome P450 alkane hydroxylase [Eremomyces bilateralis CBS 781.70]|uniref:Cytochrome P450 alkane hydroxylase n=1 Tax=Eremomyces bilateralis CBS 781.70 TaxID=1392243 RepID=A0A6G1G9V8_9PEZI|nr:putative cytochrome P450 alkane hydroxylase [Eremomyces bilateralis CBS 781.70]KAF1814782.1 putative cytochrome P450 alkane hydroxylase [Eremomyces bilateralis CBS 781.70]
MHTSILGLILLAGVYTVYFIVGRIQRYFRRKAFAAEHGCRPPTSVPKEINDVLGLNSVRKNMAAAKNKKFLESGKERFDKYGHTYWINVLGRKMIMTREKENVKAILHDQFGDFELNRLHTLGPLFGIGIFTTDGPAWKHSRAMIKPNFDRKQVANLDMFERHIQELFHCIPRDGSTVDLQELFFRLTIDSATEFLFGESVNSLSSDDTTGLSEEVQFTKAFNQALELTVMNLRLGPLSRFWYNPKEAECKKVCWDFLDKYVDKALKYRQSVDLEKATSKKGSYVFLHELAKSTSDSKRLRDELFNVLLAGRDTTASLLSNLFFHLAKQPAIWAKIVEEAQTTLRGDLPTYEQLKEMKYLQYCLSESLRLNPVVPGNARTATRDTWIPRGGGEDGLSPLFVPKGTAVNYSPFSMHRRKDYFGEDADEFVPERWESLRQNWQYLPFNGGPRICVGQQYALTEAGYVVTRFAQEFATWKMESRDPEEWIEGLTLTCCSGNGTKVGFVPKA